VFKIVLERHLASVRTDRSVNDGRGARPETATVPCEQLQVPGQRLEAPCFTLPMQERMEAMGGEPDIRADIEDNSPGLNR
jgi:hypothetical protein